MISSSFFDRLWGLYHGNKANNGNESCETLYWKVFSLSLYFLLPLAGLTIIWVRNDLVAKYWTKVWPYYLPVSFHSYNRRKLVLNWAKKRLPHNWSSYLETLSGGIADFWNDGSLLCTLINTAVPGACSNPYRHWQKQPAHAQDVACKYLGIHPMFSESDFESSLTPYLEVKLLNYLMSVQKSICKLEKEKLFYSNISTRYVVRGMGLYTAEQFKDSEFFIYSKIQSPSFYNVEILILGPYSTFCRTTVLESLIKESKNGNGWPQIKECPLDKLKQLSGFEISRECSIKIRVEMECERVKVIYRSRNHGIHEINLSCNKEVIMGSPFYVNVLKSSHNRFEEETDDVNNTNNLVNNNSTLDNYKNSCNQENKTMLISDKDKIQNNYKVGVYDDKSVNMRKKYTDTEANSDICLDKSNDCTNNSNDADNSIVDTNKEQHLQTKRNNLNNTLEISKYVKDLNKITKKNTNLDEDNPSNPGTNVSQETKNAFCFTKENYSAFQRLVDSSFRKSCRITRKSSSELVRNHYAMFSGASPICSNHNVPEDFGKLSVEEKRKKFSSQKSVALNSDEERTNSSSSINEDQKESNSKDQKIMMEKPNNTEEVSGSIIINTEDRKKLGNCDNINKNNEDYKSCAIVKKKKLFWETVFQNTDLSGHDVKNDTYPVLKNDNISKNKNSDNTKISTYNGNEITTSKSSSYPVLKQADSLALLKRQSLSKSFKNIQCPLRKKSSKCLDNSLEQSSNVSLENRAKIYLDGISNTECKIPKIYGTCVKFRTKDHSSEELNLKPPDDVLKSNSSQCKNNLSDDLSNVSKRQKGPTRNNFCIAVEYFRNLNPEDPKRFFKEITPFKDRIVKRNNTFTSGDVKSFKNFKNYTENEIKGNDGNSVYSGANVLQVFHSDSENNGIENAGNFNRKKRKSLRSLFDVLY